MTNVKRTDVGGEMCVCMCKECGEILGFTKMQYLSCEDDQFIVPENNFKKEIRHHKNQNNHMTYTLCVPFSISKIVSELIQKGFNIIDYCSFDSDSYYFITIDLGNFAETLAVDYFTRYYTKNTKWEVMITTPHNKIGHFCSKSCITLFLKKSNIENAFLDRMINNIKYDTTKNFNGKLN